MIVSINSPNKVRAASNDTIIKLNPPFGESIPVYIQKDQLYILADSIFSEERSMTLLNGPTASGKSTIIRAIYSSANFSLIARSLGVKKHGKPVLIGFDVASIEHPSSLFKRMNLSDARKIVTEPGSFVKLLIQAEELKASGHSIALHIRELSRTRTENQLALLELLHPVVEFEDQVIDVSKVDIIGDSNLGAGDNYFVDGLDEALSRRFIVNLFFDYFEPEINQIILEDILKSLVKSPTVDLSSRIQEISHLTRLIRAAKKDRHLNLTPQPNFRDMVNFILAVDRLKGIPPTSLAMAYFFKQSVDDHDLIDTLLKDVFGTDSSLEALAEEIMINF